MSGRNSNPIGFDTSLSARVALVALLLMIAVSVVINAPFALVEIDFLRSRLQQGEKGRLEHPILHLPGVVESLLAQLRQAVVVLAFIEQSELGAARDGQAQWSEQSPGQALSSAPSHSS